MSNTRSTAAAQELDQKIRSGQLRGFRIIHRNLMNYVIHYSLKYPGEPCPVRRSPIHHLDIYINAIKQLEERGLITVKRPTEDYLTWTMLPTTLLNS